MNSQKDCGNEQTQKQPTGMSSSGISLMASMEETQTPCCPPSDPINDYEKPGYKLCSYVDSFMNTDNEPIPVIKTKLEIQDLLSTIVARCGINRYSYKVAPGLYAVGSPDKDSEVLVTANFKLTFDHLRKELSDINAWILVLDTRGINVWCAAGKGTFSTAELIRQIQRSSLNQRVDHKHVIVPQLGATGISAHEVKKKSGFRVIYGPVRAKDIPAFLKNNKKADKKMRQVTFSMYERFVLTPVEVGIALKPALITALILLILSGFGPGFFSFENAWERGTVALMSLAVGIISGAFITPLLLPYLPFRQFAPKGIVACIPVIICVMIIYSTKINGLAGYWALFLFSLATSSFLAMNFTGSTPYTSPSGVEKEMKHFIPVQLTALMISTVLWIYSAF